MEVFFVATGIVALAEVGDKTQLLAFVLAARFRRPVPIVLGILVATLANHGIAAGFGVWLTELLSPGALRWIVALSFIGMAVWALVPDELEEGSTTPACWGVFGATVAAFFVAEMGDKTQIATVALAANYAALFAVVLGTTVGMLIANIPAVYLGDCTRRRVSLPLVRGVVALLFLLLGLGALLADW